MTTPKFRYIGEYPEGKSELFILGCVFSPGAEIAVPDRFIGKARGNRFFEEVIEQKPDPVEEKPVEEPRNRLLDTAPDKDALIARAEALGIKIDKRWSVEKIAAKINEAS